MPKDYQTKVETFSASAYDGLRRLGMLEHVISANDVGKTFAELLEEHIRRRHWNAQVPSVTPILGPQSRDGA